MSIRDLKGKVNDLIPVKNVLISVSDKKGLEKLVPELIGINPDVIFISTGGTYGKIKDILEDSYENNLIDVDEYTGFPEMEGGLVKTLHPKIHAGILGERNNQEHQRYLREELNEGVFIDMVVVNLYPFSQIALKESTTFEQARGNIDIGGQTMIRAAAKNFPNCAVSCVPSQYEKIMEVIKSTGGSTTFDLRLQLAREAFGTTAGYENSIVEYLSRPQVTSEKVRAGYNFTE